MGSSGDPDAEVRNLLGREFPVRRHLQLLMSVTDGADEQALIRIPRHHSRTGISTAQRVLARIQLQPAHLGVRVAGVTVLHQNRTHAGFEEINRIGGSAPSTRKDEAAQSDKPRCISDAHPQ